MNRVAQRNVQGKRTGGVIWHTTGSGKSLTMVMLARALREIAGDDNEVGRVRVIITDELDRFRTEHSAREVAPLIAA